MKKLFVLFTLVLSAFVFVACSQATTVATTVGTTTTENDNPSTLIIQFVPSTTIDTSKMVLLVNLKEMLEDELDSMGFPIPVSISIGTSYAAVIEAMVSGQVHVGFLTSQQYAFVTTENPGDVEVLLTSVRNAYECQLDSNNNPIEDTDDIIANANAVGYNGATTAAVKVNSYYSMLLVRTEDYAAYQAEGISWLAGKEVGTQSVTSGSGYVYPSFLLSQNDMSFVADDPDAEAGEVKYTTISGHQSSVLALLNNEVDAVFTFFDARYSTSSYTAWQTANPTLNIFEVTRVAALTPPIFNDTISAVSSLSTGLKAAIQQAFINIIATDEGLASLALYNHTGYLVANDADYDSERALWQFLHPND